MIWLSKFRHSICSIKLVKSSNTYQNFCRYSLHCIIYVSHTWPNSGACYIFFRVGRKFKLFHMFHGKTFCCKLRHLLFILWQLTVYIFRTLVECCQKKSSPFFKIFWWWRLPYVSTFMMLVCVSVLMWTL